MSANTGMNTDQLIDWLKSKGVRQNILDHLREEEYDGASFCMAKDEDLAELGSPRLKKGPLTKLITFRDELKSAASSEVANEVEKNSPPSTLESLPTPVVSTTSKPCRPRIPPSHSGKNSVWYKEVRGNLTAITNAIRLAPTALGALTLKFAEKEWIRAGDNLTPEQIGTMALGRIEQDANQFWEFVDVLKDTAGTNIIAGTLESNVATATGTESVGVTGSTGASTDTPSSGAINISHPALKKRPSLQFINFIKYKVGTEEKSLRAIKEIAPHWQALAHALGFSPAIIRTIAQSHIQDPEGAAQDVLCRWKGQDTDQSWAKLIKVLQDADENLKVVANDLQFALIHQLK